MDKCCTCQQIPRPQRRLHGLQLPLNYQQVIGWIIFVSSACVNFLILTEIQFRELRMVSLATYIILYVSHVISHITASILDPSERELRKLKVNTVPEFDRSVHSHVIENGRCHLCNIYTSSKNTKHCSLCNKCVDHFDHHCKWLNNCVGQRNYTAFIACVSTALLISLFTSSLCFTDAVLFFTHPEQLSNDAQKFFNCSSVAAANDKYCKDSISFLTFLTIFGVSALGIACALLHLCCFHIYISMLGVSTYEYIVNSGTRRTQPTQHNKGKCCTFKLPGKLYLVHKSSDNSNGVQRKSSEATSDVRDEQTNADQGHSDPKVTNLIGVLIANELERAKRIFIFKNKVHPHNDSNSS